jgi:UDP-N-acetylmuramoyl-tripeptide--D-alanyl-D-alanine ligase
MDMEKLYGIYLTSRQVSTDTRSIKPGSIFFALKGENFNGNRFVMQALAQGAVAAVADEPVEASDDRIIMADDVLTTLQQLASRHRHKRGIPLFAITGSNGKTTTKELCRAVLSKKYKVYATTGNLNNHIGVPLTLLSMDDSIEAGIVEMGANHPGEIRNLCSIADPDMGVITNVGKAHLEGFGSLEGVSKGKGELFAHLMKKGGTVFVNDGNEYVKKLVPSSYEHAVHYNGEEGVRVVEKESNPFLKLVIADGNERITVNTNLLGGYNAENVLAAYCLGKYHHIDRHAILEAILSYSPQNNRSQLIEGKQNRIFMDAYNANPSSMLAATNEFLGSPEKNKMLILGEMREVGESSEGEHEELIRHLMSKNAKDVICVGKSFEQALKNSGFRYFPSVDGLLDWLKENPVSGKYLFVKGSRSNKLERLLEVL